MVLAALQVHETRTALVTDPGANWTTDYAVRLAARFPGFPGLERNVDTASPFSLLLCHREETDPAPCGRTSSRS